MDAYPTLNQTVSPAGSPEPQRSAPVPAAPTRDELAQWEAEATRFLHDVERRLNGILESLNGESPAAPLTARASTTTVFDPDFEPTPARPPAGDVDRISALKVQLARKLNDFDESSDDLFGNSSQPESRP